MYRWTVRHRYGFLTSLAFVRGLIDGITPFVTRDLYLFSDAGEALLSGRFSEVFSSGDVQVGPLQLAFFGGNKLLADQLGYRLEYGITTGTSVALVLFFLFVFRACCRELGRAPLPGFELYLGLVLLLGGFTYEAATSAHPEDGFIPLLWVLVAIKARNDQSLRAGVLLGLGVGLKLLGILGLPLLLLAPSRRRALVGASMMFVVAVVSYLPFALQGSGSTFEFGWLVAPQSPLTLFVASETEFTWTMRLAQGVFVIGIGGLLALVRRGSPRYFWLVPIAITALRYLSDPLDYHYYWLGAGLIGLLGAATSMTFRPSWLRVPLAAGFSATLMPFYVWNGSARAAWITAMSLAIVAVAFWDPLGRGREPLALPARTQPP